jgi:hypothetical protein
MVDEQTVRDFFDGSDQVKSMAGHAALVLALEIAGAGLTLVAALVLETGFFPPGLMAFAGAFVGFACGMTFYSPREFRSVRRGIAERDWTLVVYSLGDWIAPLVAGLGGLWLLVQII